MIYILNHINLTLYYPAVTVAYRKAGAALETLQFPIIVIIILFTTVWAEKYECGNVDVLVLISDIWTSNGWKSCRCKQGLRKPVVCFPGSDPDLVPILLTVSGLLARRSDPSPWLDLSSIYILMAYIIFFLHIFGSGFFWRVGSGSTTSGSSNYHMIRAKDVENFQIRTE